MEAAEVWSAPDHQTLTNPIKKKITGKIILTRLEPTTTITTFVTMDTGCDVHRE